MNKCMILAGVLVVVGLSGCTGMTGKPGVGAAPRLVQLDPDSSTVHPQKVVWRHTERFGAVPKALQAKGDQSCKSVNYQRAIGYHPKALGVDGKVIPGGGFYCSGS